MITRTLYYSKDMESFATGLKRIITACQEAGCKVEFEQQAYGFAVIFYRRDVDIMGSDTYDATHDSTYDGAHDDNFEKVLLFCEIPRSKKEIMEHMGFTQVKSATKIMKPLLENGKLEMTLPDKVRSHNQKYVTKK